jgi:uncharacterized membrane-anchored protein
MKANHTPSIDRRYWFGIAFASIFGTNAGDLYAHDSGLGIGLGLLLLLGLFAITYWAETRDEIAHEIYYWLAIIIIRTGATNIADYLAFRLRIPALGLALGLAALIALLGWRASPARARPATGPGLSQTHLVYWAAMLAAGVFGTVVGDICSHNFGQAPSAIALTVLLVVFLVSGKGRTATRLWVYWTAIAIARTAGTCIGDWLADNKALRLGLPLSTLLTGTAFVAVLTLWRSPHRKPRAAA